jgi:hypothetical protein
MERNGMKYPFAGGIQLSKICGDVCMKFNLNPHINPIEENCFKKMRDQNPQKLS